MFEPLNRHIYIKIPDVKAPTTDSGILLPSDYKPDEEEYGMVQTLAWAEDVRFADRLQKFSNLLVHKKMIEEIKVADLTFHIIQDNYVVGIVSATTAMHVNRKAKEQ